MRQTAESSLASFLKKFTPEVRAVAEEARERLRKRMPNAIEMVYDNYNALVIGFSPTERVSDAILSIALYPRYVNLFFLDGTHLPDPKKLLLGSGKQVRRIQLESAADIDKPAVRALITAAIQQSDEKFDGEHQLVIKSVSKKQRARRPRE